MKNKIKHTKLFRKKLFRTIKRTPTQFLSIIVILFLASTLFSGLYSSALRFERQVNDGLRLSNTADIITTVDVNDEHPEDKEFNTIKSIVGDKGDVETRCNFSSKLNGYDNTICLSDSYPTISTDYAFENGNEECKKTNNYFVIAKRLIQAKILYGTNWVDKDGNLLPITISVPISTLNSDLGEDVVSILGNPKFLKEGKTNIFSSNYLYIKITPTGTMQNIDNNNVGRETKYTSFLSRSLFNEVLVKTIQDNYNFYQSEESLTENEKIANNLIKDPVNKISKVYYRNNQYLTKLKDSNNLKTVKNDIYAYYNTLGDDSNLLLNQERLDCDYFKYIFNDVNQTKAIAFIVPLIFIVVSTLVVLTTFSQIILKERNEIGTLKAMGYTKRSINRYYISLGLIISGIGLLLGVIVGPLVIPIILNIKFKSLYATPPSMFTYPILQVLLFIAAIFAIVSTIIFIVSNKESSLKPSFSLRPVVPKSLKSSSKKKSNLIRLNKILVSSLNNNKKIINKYIKEGKVSLNNNVIYDPKCKIDYLNDIIKLDNKKVVLKKGSNLLHFKLAIRNIRCSVPKSIMVIVGVAGCSALLGGAFGMDNASNYGINNDLRRFLSSDIIITFSSPDNTTLNSLKDLYGSEYDGKPIRNISSYSCLPASCNSSNNPNQVVSSQIYTFDRYILKSYNKDSYFIDFDDIKLDSRDLIITKKIAKQLGVQQGNYINFKVLGNTYKEIKIKAVVESFYMQGIFVSSDFYTELANLVTGAYVRVNKSVVESKYGTVKNFADELMKIKGIVNYFEYEKNFAALVKGFKVVEYLTLLLKTFAIALAVVVLYNFVILNHKQRSRDIATLKVLGFNRFQVGLSMAIEISILSLIGIIIGGSFSYLCEVLILSVNKIDFAEFIYVVYPTTYVYLFLITMATTVLVNVYLLLRNKNIKMVESLKSIE